MKRFKTINTIALMALMGVSISSCDDFLTIYPQDRIVEENFWEDRNDLEGIRYGAYQKMASLNSQFVVWGDIRSDAYKINQTYNAAQGSRSLYQKILDAQLDSTMSIYDWGGVYTCINYCNKVLQHGQEVLERDAQFTQTEWTQMKAEMTTLRALNYFYLLRSFKDIPFTTTVINSDTEVQQFSATKQLEVLDFIINDVESVMGQGRSNYTAVIDTKGLITNTAIYAILADMYLWRSALREGRAMDAALWKADAQKVLDYGQASLDALFRQTQQMRGSSYSSARVKTSDYGCGTYVQNANLISNEELQKSYNAKANIVTVDSYEAIFADGNSDESIFELQYNESDQRKNGFVGSFWGNSTGTHFMANLEAVKEILGDAYLTDSRTWYSCQDKYSTTSTGSDNPPYVFKWSAQNFGFNGGTLITTFATNDYNNWIYYRMTDVLLMMAEAHAVLSEANNDDHVKACKAIVDAVHMRSQVNQTSKLSTTAVNDKDKCIDLVMQERLIEFMGEGKRWFDLVRYAERIGGGTDPDPRESEYTDGSDGVKQMIATFLAKGHSTNETNTWKNRFKNRYGLYCPIYYMEKMANGHLIHQNPVWDRDKASEQK